MTRSKSIIEARDIVEELTQQETEKSVYRLRNAEISGKLDLSNHTIGAAIYIQNCDFLEEVDLRHCEFTQAVNFSDCTFHRSVNSGDIHAARTIYRKDLVCNKTVFKGAVTFYGTRVEGSAHFWKAQFDNEEEPVDFSLAHFGNTLECEETIFKGPVNFNGLRCNDSGVFYTARFEGEHRTDFRYASFGGNLECDHITFEGPANFGSVGVTGGAFFEYATFGSKEEANFGGAVFGNKLVCDRAVFKGRANFNALRCSGAALFRGVEFVGAGGTNFDYASFGHNFDCSPFDSQRTVAEGPINSVFRGAVSLNTLTCSGSGFFTGAKFEEGVDFGHASFGVNLVCNGATFQGQANFDTLKCSGSGFFHDVTFEKEVDFRHASLGKNLGCDDAIFKRLARFRSLSCEDSALLRNARFEGDVDLAFASLGGNLECNGDRTVFERRVNLNRIRCGGSGRFDDARFLSSFKPEKATFAFAYFGLNLNLMNTHFAGPIDLSMTRIVTRLILTRTYFGQEVTLRGASMGQLRIGEDTVPFKRASVDLRDCSFQSFIGNKEIAVAFARWAQNPTTFVRAPYLQLEKYFHSIGDEVEAKRIHYQGRRDLRENAKNKRGGTKWPWWTKWGDWWLKWLTGYGVRTWYLLFPICFFVIVGTAVFWSDDSLKPRVSATSGTASGTFETSAQPTDTAVSSISHSEEQGVDSWEQRLFHRFAYSLDLFLPVVNLHIDVRWEPQGLGREIYALVHSMVGWLLIPLLVASLAGIIRRQ